MAKLNKNKPSAGRVVFSTELGRLCSTCGRQVAQCRCADNKRQESKPESDGIVRVRREKKGRGGKTVTTISGVPLAEEPLKDLVSALKKRCGCGGSLKEGVIEIQGDHVELLIAELIKHGFQAKKSGG